MTDAGVGGSLSADFRVAAQRQREILIARIRELREGADHVRCLADQLEAEADEAGRQVTRIGLVLGIEPQLELDDADEVLRGRRLRDVAVAILRERNPAEPVHYTEWYAWLEEQRVRVAGQDPVATFLATVSRDPAVERVGRRSGRYRLRAA
jgi:DNA-directed RNA polymerase beta subunit